MLLRGVRVVELGQNIAGPFASLILADLGADVIKVERPGLGDDARRWGPPFWEGEGSMFHYLNRNKRSVAVDIKDPDDLGRLLDLIGTADVFVHNMRPGAADQAGLGAAALTARFPRLVYGAMGAFGRAGPLNRRPGYELLMQAFAGIMSVTGMPGGPPVRAGTSVNDLGTGMWCAIGVLAALFARERTGRGAVIDTSLLETAVTWTGISAAAYQASGEEPQPLGTGHPQVKPMGVYHTQDGPLVIAAGNDRLWARLAAALGRPEYAQDPRFVDNAARVGNRDVLDAFINDSVAAMTRAQVTALLEEAGVPCAPLHTIPEALAHEQTRALGIVQEPPGEHPFRQVGLPISVDGQRPPIRTAAPGLGADTGEVFGGLGAKEAS
ncbi:MAG: CoA transferase [Hyphomicrobiales bacterium]|nr:CoA transferase [Hyphomicrobiales bacterium]MCP5374071.1 CoA transferase [Hyphomicrobiales bacterium]